MINDCCGNQNTPLGWLQPESVIFVMSISSNQTGVPPKFSSAVGQAPLLPANKNCSLENKPSGWQLLSEGRGRQGAGGAEQHQISTAPASLCKRPDWQLVLECRRKSLKSSVSLSVTAEGAGRWALLGRCGLPFLIEGSLQSHQWPRTLTGSV